MGTVSEGDVVNKMRAFFPVSNVSLMTDVSYKTASCDHIGG